MESKIVVALKGIIIHNDKCLIIKRSSDDEIGADMWEFAGGKLDFGESLESALKREIKEETGLDVTVDKLLYATELINAPNRQVVILCYLCRCNTESIVLSEEHSDYLWADKELLMSKLDKPILNDLIKNGVLSADF